MLIFTLKRFLVLFSNIFASTNRNSEKSRELFKYFFSSVRLSLFTELFTLHITELLKICPRLPLNVL